MTMPTDTNPSTVSVDSIRPVKVGDILCVYADIEKVGKSSVQVHVDTWVRHDRIGEHQKVTEATFKFVALDDDIPVAVPAKHELPTYALSD